MQNKSQKPKKVSPTIVGLIAVGLIIVSIVAWLTPWVWVDPFPKPLGDRLEYIGKKDYGCWLGYCDSKVGTTYYYATDMSIEEVEGYFRGAKIYQEPHKLSYPQAKGALYRFDFYSNSSREGFYFDFYSDGIEKSKSAKLKVTKRHLIELDYSNYWAANKSL